MTNQRRNELCACGSGKKYKRCCLLKDASPSAEGLEYLIHEARLRGLEHDRVTRDNAESKLLQLAADPRATKTDKLNIAFGLVELAQRRGDYRSSLVRLDAIRASTKGGIYLQMLNFRAVALTHLDDVEGAAKLYDRLLASPEAKDFPGWYIEAGRTYSLANRNDDAIRVTKIAIEQLETSGSDAEGLARAKSNLAMSMMDSADPQEVEHAEALLEEMSDFKLSIGDWEGAANNFSNLSLHHLSAGRFEKAIVYGRKDLRLSRVVGDERGLAMTLINLAFMYARLLQLTDARRSSREAFDIAERLDNPDLRARCVAVDKLIADVGRTAGVNGIPIGPKTPCACGSENAFQACCGRADHEPVPWGQSRFGIAEDVAELGFALERSGLDLTKLDVAMRKTEQASRRVAWTQLKTHDGWAELFELPDMANIHLSAAESLARQSKQDEDSLDGPLACTMLAVSALEAFINSTIYFACEAASARAIDLEADILTDPFGYQRRTELTLKWNSLGAALCNDWPPPSPLWSNFVRLVQLRNELVHFKAAGYERVAPLDKRPPEQLRNLSPEIQLREVPRSWPVRLLTPSFAEWTISTARALIDHFRSSYKYAIRQKPPADQATASVSSDN